MEWLALIIPILTIVITLKFFSDKFIWWEYGLLLFSTIFIILVSKAIVKTTIVSDTEYWGSQIVEARYYEEWSTWVDQTCTRTYSCNCDSKGNCQTCTETYDCSYCSRHSAYWEAYDNAGNSWRISEDYYNYLIKKWNANPQFIELNRTIHNHWGCGKDGDAYSIRWNGEVTSSENAVTEHSYVNKVQASHSTFKLKNISNKEAKQLGLYPYPKFHDYYKQKVILGLDSIYNYTENIDNLFQYFNGYYGSKNKIKLFICLFYDKPLSISYDQEAYWDGGNQNEIVICIGLDKSNKQIQWVRPFSWTDRKRILVDLRENIAELDYFSPEGIYSAIQQAVNDNIVYKDFKKDFNYLTVDLPGWSFWLIWILTIVANGAWWYWSFTNEFENENNW